MWLTHLAFTMELNNERMVIVGCTLNDVQCNLLTDLPTALIKDLLPNLNMVDLDYVQPTVKLKGKH